MDCGVRRPSGIPRMTNPIRQETFWDRPVRRIEMPAARATDPQSSHDAADEHTARGARQCNIERVVDHVRAFEGLTSAEIAKRTGLERHEAARRLPDAEKAGAVQKGAMRRCSISGRLVVTWWPAA
jgi:hypothetical protein